MSLRALRIALWIASTAAGSAFAQTPQRVVSMNLCTDQLALLTARPGQLVSVTWIAQDATRNPLAARAQGLVANRGEAEEILALKPDLVLTGTYTTRMTVGALRRLGVPVVELAPMQSLEDLREQTKEVARLLGNEQAADVALATLPPPRELTAFSRRALMLGPAGSVANAANLGGDLLHAAGFVNLADKLPPRPWTNLTIEEILYLRSDVIVTADDDGASASLARAMLDHPALRRASSHRHVSIPRGASSCAAPVVAEALAALQAANAR
jgi:iron complex transport system substrate-binding protein